MLQFSKLLSSCGTLCCRNVACVFPVRAKEENNDSEQESVCYAFETCGLLGFLWCCLLYWIRGRTVRGLSESAHLRLSGI